MDAKVSQSDLAVALEVLIGRAEALSADYDEIVQDAVRAAREAPLGEAETRSLYERILTILRTAQLRAGHVSGEDIAGQIRREAEVLLERRRVVAAKRATPEETFVRGGLTFHKRWELTPRPVLPVPTFNGKPVLLQEGYVDVTTLPLWIGNHRVELQVAEFREVNHRDPSMDELLLLMHGKLALPGLEDKDPFKLKDLAKSIARKGVERAPILTWEGEPKDGNRRIAASRLVIEDPSFSYEEKERARWIRVWQAPEGTSETEFDAIVVALNFEPDYKESWPEYVKARLVVERYRRLKEDFRGSWSERRGLELRKQVADQFAIEHSAVKRYLEMVQWAEDFEEYHEAERGLEPAAVRYKTNENFQWFYEVQAGRGQDKLIAKLQQDDDLRALTYDLMYDVLDSGLQVRNLHKVVADEAALNYLKQAHDEERPEEAIKFVDMAIAEAQKNSPTKRLGFEQFLRSAVDRLGATPPDQWRSIDSALLNELRRVFHGSIGSIEGELAVRITDDA